MEIHFKIPSAEDGNDDERGEEEPQSEELPNLRVTNVYFEPDPVIIGQPFTVHYTIENQSVSIVKMISPLRLFFTKKPESRFAQKIILVWG